MKRRFIAALVCLFWSVLLLAQTDDRNEPDRALSTKGCGSVDVWVDRVVWNANYDRLEAEAEIEKQNFAPSTFAHDLNFMAIDASTSYHIAVLRFRKNGNFKSGDTFRFDISAEMSQWSNKPLYLLFANHPTHPTGLIRVNYIDDYTLEFEIGGSNNSPVLNNSGGGKAGGGVITSVGIMGRAKSLSSNRCMYFNLENRITEKPRQDCLFPNETYDICSVIEPETRVEADNTSVHSYPNPAQDYLFVEANKLDIQGINILNLQGQSVSHQAPANDTEDILQIDTKGLATGLYILQLETTSGRVSKKIYVQR